MPNLVYILTNPGMPDLIKIGLSTTSIEQRIKELSGYPGVPVLFECYYCCEVNDCNEVERRLHDGFADYRINPKREFFRVNPERVKAILEGWAIKEIVPDKDVAESKEELDSLNKARSRASIFKFNMVDIPIDSKLTFFRDESKVSTVTGDREIEFEGERGSISGIALKLLNELAGRNWISVRGPDHWVFEGETLTERRIRMEDNNNF